MGVFLYHVHADWDPEAGVWVATSDDVPGLATEAATLEALTQKLHTLIPELLEANQLLGSDQPEIISFELTSLREEKVRLLRSGRRDQVSPHRQRGSKASGHREAVLKPPTR